jgi:hypothetical protein
MIMDYRLGMGGFGWLRRSFGWNAACVFYFDFWHEIEWFYHWIAWWM